MTFAGRHGNSDGHAMGADGAMESFKPITESPQSAHTSNLNKPGRLRSRTSTFSYTPPLPPLMSRENSSEELSTVSALPSTTMFTDQNSEAGPSKPRQHHHRYTPSRPQVANIRTTSYNAAQLSAPRSPISPNGGKDGAMKARVGLKRRISTPIIANIPLDEEDFVNSNTLVPASAPSTKNTQKGEAPSRARATSTSLVNPSAALEAAAPTIPVPTLPRRPASRPTGLVLPQPGISFTPPSSDDEHDTTTNSSRPSILERAYNTTESSLARITSLFRSSTSDRSPLHTHALQRRGSDEDSEKGLNGDDDSLLSGEGDLTETTASRSSTDTDRLPRPSRGRYWGIWASEDKASTSDQDPDGYFSSPPTPPDNDLDTRRGSQEFAEALLLANGKIASLPTPAISAHSLSRGRSPERMKLGVIAGIVAGWGRGKTGAVLRELGWTVGILILGFFGSLGVALWLLKTLPITTLRHLPKSTTDVQLLSAEIKTYMTSSDIGWYHTVAVLTFVGCWKHAWSVPGAIVLNILVGSLLSPIPALGLLTIITATGSLGSYLLSRPLAPLIAVLFPKPLSLVRAALAPESAPPSTLSTHSRPTHTEHVTPINLSDPSDPSIGTQPSTSLTPTTKPNIWRRLLIMRAMGIVPWSGMNVACGVVGVDWRIFWLTTAAGSASWSYVTASIGDLLARLAIPSSVSATGVDPAEMEGESLTAMLRDPALIAKLVFLTALTLIPVFLKKSSSSASASTASKSTSTGSTSGLDEKTPLDTISDPTSPVSPMSPLAQSLARFTPTPAVFDVLSFGRTVLRTGVGAVGSGIRQAGAVLSKASGR